MLRSIDDVQTAMRGCGYLAERSLATAVFLAMALEKPLLLEGEAGVGKTEVAKVLSAILGSRLIRLQGYEGIDVSHALYEWNYARQIMAIRLSEATEHVGTPPDVFGSDFLIKRPLLQALEGVEGEPPPVLLLDELDRVDDEFEAFLLEILSDFQVTIPELGTVTASVKPLVIITSNRTRELHDALKRRCLYHWIDYPTLEKEYAIVVSRIPDAPEMLSRQVVSFVGGLREADLYKAPGIAETLDWMRALLSLHQDVLDPAVVEDTLGVVLKNQEDVNSIRGETTRRLLGLATA